jgi:hypothetical protein
MRDAQQNTDTMSHDSAESRRPRLPSMKESEEGDMLDVPSIER